ncbi:MAG TPA: hypothetical protein VFO18_01285 [Methylomirabilota bacterium]|nr:hypothetical protein [Methylomirabilota bacterium]
MARAAQPPPPAAAAPGFTAASAQTVQELQATLARARERFEARDAAGVLAYVSDQYRSGLLTKALIREQLLGIFGLYEAVRARVTIDAVDMVDGAARVYTTGEVSGRLPIVKRWVTFLWWEREPEVARREGSVWRLYGFHEQPAPTRDPSRGSEKGDPSVTRRSLPPVARCHATMDSPQS